MASVEESISGRDLDLDDIEVDLLLRGLREWGGPARATDKFAIAMGFNGAGHIVAQCKEIHRRLSVQAELRPNDWTRALLALELAFASDVIGSGTEWATTTGLQDCDTVRTLRSLQRKLGRIVFPVIHGEGGQGW